MVYPAGTLFAINSPFEPTDMVGLIIGLQYTAVNVSEKLTQPVLLIAIT